LSYAVAAAIAAAMEKVDDADSMTTNKSVEFTRRRFNPGVGG